MSQTQTGSLTVRDVKGLIGHNVHLRTTDGDVDGLVQSATIRSLMVAIGEGPADVVFIQRDTVVGWQLADAA